MHSVQLALLSQDYNPEELEQILERIAEETGIAPELDAIEAMMANPINLTTATIKEIVKIPGFTHSIAKRILQIVKSNREIDYNQISDTLNLSHEQAYLLQLCTVIETHEKKKESQPGHSFYWRARINNQFEERKGFTKGIYLGTPLDYYQRASLFLGDFSANIITTKDAGENKLVDFYSLNVTGKIFDTKITLGDFYVESGLGSILWKSFGLRKGSDAITPIAQQGYGISPYRSSLQYDFFRGIGIQKYWHININNNLFTAFWLSSNNRSAYIDTTINAVTSIKQDGYFRTANELERKNNLIENSIGGILEWHSKNISFGASAIGLNYDKPIYSKSKKAFWGSSGILSSLYAIWNNEPYTILTELSRDAYGNLGIKTGILYEQEKWSTAILFRSFAGDFRSPYGYNFGESSIPSNETGLYWGINLKFFKNINISAYFDIFNNYTRTYDISMPGKGNEMFTEMEWKIEPKTICRMRVRYENKTAQVKDSSLHYRLFQSSRYSIRAEIEQSIASKFKFRGRIETAIIEPEAFNQSEKGISAFIEFVWLPLKEARLGCRFTYFSTDSYNSAIWQYEAVMPGIMMAPALYGNGSRAYIFAKLSPSNFLDIWAKFTYLSKNNVKTLGSSWDEIPSNEDNSLLIQAEIKF